MHMRRPSIAVAAALLAAVAVSAQPAFEATVKDLESPDPGVRHRAVRLLKEAAYPEAALPLVRAVADPEDAIRLDAIAAELNIFLARKIVPRRRIGYVIEVRNRIAAEAAFSAGPSALGPLAVPAAVADALRGRLHDDNPQVALEALYAFGTLAPRSAGARDTLLPASAPELASMLGAADPAFRLAALRVIGRVYEQQPGDPPVEPTLGDAVIGALNDKDLRPAAMDALGAMRYARAVQALTDLFRYFGRGDLAEASLDALARIGNPSSTALFAEQLSATDPAMRTSAIEGLARAGDRASATLIEPLTKDRDSGVAAAATRAVARLRAPGL